MLMGLVCVEGYAPVDVELSVVGQVIVDDQGNLRDIQPSSPDVCRDQNPTETQNTAVRLPSQHGPTRVTRSITRSRSPGSGSELLHDGLSLFLRHVSVHGGHGEVGLSHLLRQPVHLEHTHTHTCSVSQNAVQLQDCFCKHQARLGVGMSGEHTH